MILTLSVDIESHTAPYRDGWMARADGKMKSILIKKVDQLAKLNTSFDRNALLFGRKAQNSIKKLP